MLHLSHAAPCIPRNQRGLPACNWYFGHFLLNLFGMGTYFLLMHILLILQQPLAPQTKKKPAGSQCSVEEIVHLLQSDVLKAAGCSGRLLGEGNGEHRATWGRQDSRGSAGTYRHRDRPPTWQPRRAQGRWGRQA